MGYCGCESKPCTTTAGVISLIQSILGFSLTCYFLKMYYVAPAQQYGYLMWKTFQRQDAIRGLLVFSALFQGTWIISSAILLFGNLKDNACLIYQWVFITIMIIIAEILLPPIAIGLTIGAVTETYADTVLKNLDKTAQYTDDDQENSVKFIATGNYYGEYALLILSFTRGGIFTIALNTALCVFTNRRVQEILDHKIGYMPTASPLYNSQQKMALLATNYPCPQTFIVEQQQPLHDGFSTFKTENAKIKT